MKSVLATGLLPRCSSFGEGDGPEVVWLSAETDDAGRHGLLAYLPEKRTSFTVPVGFRGHAVLPLAEPHRVLLVGRRPSTKSAIVDLRARAVETTLEARPGCCFQGHAVLTEDGGVMLTTEADLETSAGFVVVRPGPSYAPEAAFSTHGLGPHELAWMPDRASVVVANGGLHQRPETGREILNLDAIDSSLVYLDATQGDLLEQARLPDSKAGLRHLDVGADGTVAVGLQLPAPLRMDAGSAPLVVSHRRGEALRALEAPDAIYERLRGYVGSVAVSDAAGTVLVTSPHGDLAVGFGLDDGKYRAAHALTDVCGVAAVEAGEAYAVSSSTGWVRTLDARTFAERESARTRLLGVRWDNHMLTAGRQIG